MTEIKKSSLILSSKLVVFSLFTVLLEMQEPDLRGPSEILIGQSLPSNSETAPAEVVEAQPSTVAADPIDWPDKIRMSGLPVHLWGYNTTFLKSNRLINGTPEYVLAPYKLYYFISIIGLRIFKSRDGEWIAQHYDPEKDTAVFGSHTRCIVKLPGETQDTPLGMWECNGVVKRA